MQEEFNNPQEELKRIKKVIRQYEIILKTSVSDEQRQRVGKQLKELRKIRDEILITFHIENEDEEESSDAAGTGEDEKEFAFLKMIQKEYKISGQEEMDKETYGLFSYLTFFIQEFSPFLSERMLKLDFKYSLDRDSFYYLYQDIKRMMDDLIQELIQLDNGDYRKEEELEIRKRNLKRRRILMIEANKFFMALKNFAEDLLADIAQDGSKCLNNSDEINFDSIEGRKYFEGYRVDKVLGMVRDFAAEVISFLNIPEFEQEE